MSKSKEKDFLADGSGWQLSLNKLTGKKIVDVIGYPSCPFDENTPVFKICEVVFEDGTTVNVEGEHDTPYIPADDGLNNMDEKTLKKLSDDE